MIHFVTLVVSVLLLSLTALLLFLDSGSSQPLLSIDETQTLLSALIRSLLRRAGGCGVPRSSSLLYRGFLYSCITRVLQSSLSSTALAIDGQGASDEGKGNEVRGHDELMALEQCSTELSDTLGTDACTGPPVWRVVALAALSSVLTSLGPSRSQHSSKSRGNYLSISFRYLISCFASHRMCVMNASIIFLYTFIYLFFILFCDILKISFKNLTLSIIIHRLQALQRQ